MVEAWRELSATMVIEGSQVISGNCCPYCQFGGVLSKQMPYQDGQGRKLPHIVSIVANLPITEVEGHYRNLGVSAVSTLKQATATSGEDGTLSSSFSEF